MTRKILTPIAIGAITLLTGCYGANLLATLTPNPDSGADKDDAQPVYPDALVDSGTERIDVGFTDVGNPFDSGTPDIGLSFDADIDASIDSGPPDLGLRFDAEPSDSGGFDAAVVVDTGPPPHDAGFPLDATPPRDVGFASDAMPLDTGPPPDSGGMDTGHLPADTGPPPMDGGVMVDGGDTDTGPTRDVGLNDAGAPCIQQSLNDDFEAYTLGSLNGQTGWTGNGLFVVQNSDVFEGSRAISYPAGVNSNDFIRHPIAPASEGYQAARMKAGQTNAVGGIQLGSNVSDNEINCAFRQNGVFSCYDSSAWIPIPMGAYTANVWILFEIEWRSVDKMFRVRIDGGPWSSWMRSVSAAWTTIDNVAAYANGRGGVDGSYAWDFFVSGCTTP